MIKNRDIIIIGIQAWDIEIGSNCKNIALELAKNNRVLYVNTPLDRSTASKKNKDPRVIHRKQVIKGEKDALSQLSENMWNLNPAVMIESINKIPGGLVYNLLNKRNNKLFAREIRKAIKKLNFKNYILFNDSSMFLGQHQKKLLKPSIYVYYMRDNLIKNPYWRRHGVKLEPELIARADLVVNNSTLYTKYGKKFNEHSYMVGQGCDISSFDERHKNIEIAEELKNISSPIIGYVGFLTSRRLDIALIEGIAKKRPDWSIVLVGPEDEAFQNSALHSCNNVHFLGSKDEAVLPNYIKGFDICINPQLINDATIGNYPRKIDEYLAMGKPTLATATEAMDYFREYTYLGKNQEDYISLAEKALQEDSAELQENRRKYAQSHSWENNVAEIGKYIEMIEKENKE